jgi:hypothetical protein
MSDKDKETVNEIINACKLDKEWRQKKVQKSAKHLYYCHMKYLDSLEKGTTDNSAGFLHKINEKYEKIKKTDYQSLDIYNNANFRMKVDQELAYCQRGCMPPTPVSFELFRQRYTPLILQQKGIVKTMKEGEKLIINEFQKYTSDRETQ